MKKRWICLLLAAGEARDLAFLNEAGLPVALLVNSGGPVELTDALDLSCVKAVLYLSQPGQEGGAAAAELLAGDAVPSGKLACTWARRYGDYPPCARSFSDLDGDVTKDRYTDGIFVGYRWFDSFGVPPLFPFGFGLSYTAFSVEPAGLTAAEGKAILSLRVRNTGDRYPGKETVQIYAVCPGRLPKEQRRLVGFQKTKLLAPGEEQLLQIEFSQMDLASASPPSSWQTALRGCGCGNATRWTGRATPSIR